MKQPPEFAAYEQARADLDKAARPYFCDGRFGAMRALEHGDAIPAPVQTALDACHAAGLAWSRARGF